MSEKVLGFKEKDCVSFGEDVNNIEYFEIKPDKLVPVVSLEWFEEIIDKVEKGFSVGDCSGFGSAGAGVMKSAIVDFLKERLKIKKEVGETK